MKKDKGLEKYWDRYYGQIQEEEVMWFSQKDVARIAKRYGVGRGLARFIWRYTEHAVDTWRILERYVADGVRVLEVGCGTGGFSIAMLLRFGDKKFEYCAMDYSIEGLRSAKKRLVKLRLDNRISLLAGDMLELPFSDGEFDMVVCPSVIEHLPEQKRACEEMVRVCKKSGVLVVSTDHKLGVLARTGMSSFFALGGRILRKLGVLKTPQGYFIAHTRDSFSRLFEGLPVKPIQFEFTHFGVIGLKRWVGRVESANEKTMVQVLEALRKVSVRWMGFSHAMFIATISKK